MDVFDRAAKALKKHIEANSEQVKKDLEEMKAKSTIGWEKQLGLKK